MILAKPEILRKIETGEIKIEPFNESLVGAGSVDMRLGNEFRVFKKDITRIRATDDVDHREYTEKKVIDERDYFVIEPGEVVFGITKEKIELADNICGWIEGRSRFGRIGLVVHMTAGYIQPGSHNRQVLEIGNFGPVPIEISPGVPVCQVIFEETRGKARPKGRFQGQEHV